MENNIYIKRNGILEMNPVWVSLNKGKYKLYISNPILLSTNQRENTVRVRDMFFIHSKKIDFQIEDTSFYLNIRIANQITKLTRWFRIGILIVALFCILYIMSPFRFLPKQALPCILFGYMGIAILIPSIFKRKKYFEVQ